MYNIRGGVKMSKRTKKRRISSLAGRMSSGVSGDYAKMNCAGSGVVSEPLILQGLAVEEANTPEKLWDAYNRNKLKKLPRHTDSIPDREEDESQAEYMRRLAIFNDLGVLPIPLDKIRFDPSTNVIIEPEELSGYKITDAMDVVGQIEIMRLKKKGVVHAED